MNIPSPGGPTRGQIDFKDFKGNFDQIIPLCNKMHEWQRQIYQNLTRGNKDIYIAASPGAGKTLPYLCYWMSGILRLKTSGLFREKQANYLNTLFDLLILHIISPLCGFLFSNVLLFCDLTSLLSIIFSRKFGILNFIIYKSPF